MDLEPAEIIIFQYYLQPCCSEKAEAVISSPPAPEGGTADRVVRWPNGTLAAPASVWASGTMAVPGSCLSRFHAPTNYTTFAASKKFSNLREVGTSVCIPARMGTCSVLDISLGENRSDVLYFHQRPPLAPCCGSSHTKQRCKILRTPEWSSKTPNSSVQWNNRSTSQVEVQIQAKILIMWAVQGSWWHRLWLSTELILWVQPELHIVEKVIISGFVG